jgi:predicted AAA+ superfamily ATPase
LQGKNNAYIMDINAYKQVITDQRKEKDEIVVSELTARREESFFEFDSPLAQIVTGVRRSGKSTLCHKVLKQNNIEYAYIIKTVMKLILC